MGQFKGLCKHDKHPPRYGTSFADYLDCSCGGLGLVFMGPPCALSDATFWSRFLCVLVIDLGLEDSIALTSHCLRL